MITVIELEEQINNLTDTDKLLLIEKLAHGLRGNNNLIQEDDLIEMANDSEMQAELSRINRDFAGVENDGLANL